MTEKLRILSCNPNGGAFHYIVKGWENAFKALGHSFQRWKGSEDQLKKFKPHIYLGCSGWQQSFPIWARSAFGTKIGIHVNPWGSTVLKPLPGENNVNEPVGTIRWVRKQNPDFVYCYGLQNDIDHMWDYWFQKAGIVVVPAPTAGDTVIHKPVPEISKYKCDVGFVGGFWKYKGINLRKYLIPVLNKTNAMVYGWGGWNHPKYRGKIANSEINSLFSSAKICPTVVEPHTTRYGIDVPERMFKIPLGGGFTICDPFKGIERYIKKDIFPVANNPKEYLDLILYYIKHDDKREQLREQQRHHILAHHTYFSRIQVFLNMCNYEEQARDAQEKVKEISK